jgi:hypothetical protein
MGVPGESSRAAGQLIRQPPQTFNPPLKWQNRREIREKITRP